MAGIDETVHILAQAYQALGKDRQADAFLQEFRKGPAAWSVCERVLLGEEPELRNIRVFCAMTVAHKLKYCYVELSSAEQRMALRHLIMELIRRHHGTPNILTQLCVGLAILAVQMEEWVTPIEDVVGMFGDQGIEIGFACLLEFVARLPEVAFDNEIPVTGVRRSAVIKMINEASGNMLHLLLQFLSQAGYNQSHQKAVFRAFRAWLRYCQFPPADLAQSDLVPNTFLALNSMPHLFKDTWDTVCELVRHTDETEKYHDAVAVIIPNILELADRFRRPGLDEDESYGLARIFCDTGERYMRLILRAPEFGVRLVELILLCSGHEDTKVSSMSLYFWYMFSADLSRDRDQTLFRTDPANLALIESALPIYAPSFVELVTVLMPKLQYPELDMDLEQEDEFKKYRHDVQETLRDACKVVGGSAILTRLHQLLGAAVQRAAESLKPDGSFYWQEIESCLYCIRSIAWYLKFEEELMPQIIDNIQHLPPHPRLRYTITLLYGGFCDWFAVHPAGLGHAYTYVTSCLAERDLEGAATVAIKNICEGCPEHLAERVGELVGFYEQSWQGMSEDSRMDLVKAVSYVAAVAPWPDTRNIMRHIYQPLLERLGALCEAVKEDTIKVLSRRARHIIELMSTLVQCSHNREKRLPPDMAHPCVELLDEGWQVFNLLLNTFISDEDVCELFCDGLVKHIVRAADKLFGPVLQHMLPTMAQCFATRPYSCFMYVPNVCAGVFALSPEYEDQMNYLLDTFSTAAFALLTTPESFSEHADVVMEYFELIIRFLRRRPCVIIQVGTGFLESLIAWALVGVHVEHEKAARATLAFFEHILKCGNPQFPEPPGQPLDEPRIALLAEHVIRHGEPLVRACIQALLGNARLADSVTSVLQLLLQLCKDHLENWLTVALTEIPTQFVTTSDQQITFINLISATDKKLLQDALMELSRLYRSRAFAGSDKDQQR